MIEVQVENLHKRFDEAAVVRGVSFAVRGGEVLGFLGPNGAGKSTTMRMITGFLVPDEGRVLVAGHDPIEEPVAARRRLGYLPEGAPLYADMTPLGLLHFIAECRGYDRAERRRRIDETAERVRLEAVLHQRIETLSKGYKRRLGLALAILHDPDVLILDEPTDGLDPTQKIEVRKLIRTMARDKVIILSTHILEEVEAVCSRAVIIADGQVVADDTPAGLSARSRRHNRVVVRIEGGGGDAGGDPRQLLGAVEGVASVEVHEGESEARTEYRLVPTAAARAATSTTGGEGNGADDDLIVRRVAELALAQRWKVLELRRAGGSMEEVFATLTQNPNQNRGAD